MRQNKKLKKYIIFILLFIFFILNLSGLFNLTVYADNYNVHSPLPDSFNNQNNQNYLNIEETTVDLLNGIYDAVGGNDVKKNMPDSAKEYLTDYENGENSENFENSENADGNLKIEDISSKFSLGFIFNMAMRAAGSLTSAAVRNFIPVVAFILLSAVVEIVKNLHEPESSSGFSEILNFVMIICLAGAVFYSVRGCFFTAKKFLEDIHMYMMTMIPVMASLSTLSGNFAAAAVNSSGLYAVLNVVDGISADVILPVLQICYALSLAQNITESSGTINLSGISSYIRSALNWIFIFIMTVLVTILFFQNILASSADTVAARAIKFSVTSFVPVVGGVIGDASRTIMGSIQAVKSITGIFGVLVIIATLLPPLITVVLHKLMLKISGAVALILGMDRQSNFFKEMNSLLDITLAIMISVAVVFIFDITIFIKTVSV